MTQPGYRRGSAGATESASAFLDARIPCQRNKGIGYVSFVIPSRVLFLAYFRSLVARIVSNGSAVVAATVCRLDYPQTHAASSGKVF